MKCLASVLLSATCILLCSGLSRGADLLESIPQEIRQPAANAGRMVERTYPCHYYTEKREFSGYELERQEEPITKPCNVYLPYGYNEDTKYPVIYVMHGITDNEDTWLERGNPKPAILLDNLIASGAIRPCIAVFPNGNSCKNFLDRGFANQAGYYFFGNELANDLIPFIESEYSVEADRQSRAICGFSMGGMQLINVGLCHHLDKFAWFGAFAAAPTTFQADEIVEYLKSQNKEKSYPIGFFYNVCGVSDGTSRSHDPAVQGLTEKSEYLSDATFAYHRVPGGHDYNVSTVGLCNLLRICFAAKPEGETKPEPAAETPETAPAAVLPGLNADPHIAVFGDTYYVYPTTDGTEGWMSTFFRCWSSKDLVAWKNEGEILNLPRDLSWAEVNAWAPAIATKDGKYYFYYSARQQVGVAVADSPTGPFKDPLDRALVPRGRYQCQCIDPMVFVDDDGSAYLYFGQGNCNVVKVNDDMISYPADQVKRITPPGYNEGSFVFKRKGVYYLSWSEHDTRDPAYCVAYGTSDSPMGPFTKAETNPILKGKGVVKGAGHHSIVQIPGRDEWVICYHRFRIPDGNGYNRETCLSPLRFDDAGNILPVDVFEAVGAVK